MTPSVRRCDSLPVLGALLALCVLGPSTACMGNPEPEPVWKDGHLKAPTEQVLWNIAQLALEKEGFPLQGAPDRSERKIVSGWKTSLSAFRAQGYRSKATIAYTRGEDGRYDLRVRVERELNMDIVRPLDASYAEWEPASDDERAARVLLQTIRSYMRPELPQDDTDSE